MDLSKQTPHGKKSKPSFWNRLLRLPSKSQVKEKHDDSFKRQSVQYSSLTSPRVATPRGSDGTSDESVNFTTLESSAFMDVHRDAGILFLNKSSVASCFAPKEENKHVQFAPTPMNKYYKVDVKSAPCKKHREDDDKENSQQTSRSEKACRPILRVEKSRKISLRSSSGEETEGKTDSRLVNVKYIDGPEFKTPSIPRTSTKIALIDRKNGSLPQLNVSSVVKYNSLPRSAKNVAKNGSENLQFSREGSSESLGHDPNKNITRTVNMPQQYRRSMRGLNTHRQSCYGVSDPSRIFEGEKVLQTQYRGPDQDVRHRLSLGRPLNSQVNNYSNHQSQTSIQKSHMSQENQKSKFFNMPMPSRKPSYAKSLDQPIRNTAISNHGCLTESNSNRQNRPHYHASTGHIPNKAINEVGLPIVDRQKRIVPNKTRSSSPQYIPLCETFSTNKDNLKQKEKVIPPVCYRTNQPLNADGYAEKIVSKKPKESATAKNKMSTVGSVEQCNEPARVISETRKQAIKSAMYMKKRKMVNKFCKYNSKQSDEGFSSMADDECSFNCSCPSCITKLSRNYKRSGLKQFFSHNKEKYFFTIEPEIKAGNELERLPENQTVEGSMAVAQPHLSNKNENGPTLDKTWYECDDTLCHSPNKSSTPEKPRGSRDGYSTPVSKIVDNIYENITQIINSATKSNLKPQDVKRILSTPSSSPLTSAGTKSQSKTQRNLFPDPLESNACKKLDQSLKKMLTPVKTTDCFNDSIVLLQEIFQKLSQECKELLQPNVPQNTLIQSPTNKDSPGNKYIDDIVKSLKSSELSEADFANIIGGIAQNIFSETKAKSRKVRILSHSVSLPDLKKNASIPSKALSAANSLKALSDFHTCGSSTFDSFPENKNSGKNLEIYEDLVPGVRQLPDGWSRTPTTENSNISDDISAGKLCSSGTDKDSSKCSEGELLLLENTIRLGMGLNPVEKVNKTSMCVTSPKKVSKYKSRDVLSGKGKLKLKIYYNSGLVTVFVMKAAKLDWANNRELNAYVKITMTPDESKRVHWRTNVQKSQKNPVFNQKFSFELLPEDETKRLIFSVWHRDYAKQRSELVGCMSFSVKHVMDNTHNVDGWYRLLRERFGTQKHFAAHAGRNSCSFKK